MGSKDIGGHSRRDLMRGAALGGGVMAALGGMGINPLLGAAWAKEAGKATRPLKAAFSNAGLQATWCAQGKQAAEYWGSLFNVEVTWFDGQLDAVKQRSAIDNMASQKWDFVAIQAFGIGTLTAPGQQDDRGRHAGHRHGHADRAARHHRRPRLPRARQRVHGRLGDAGAGQRHQWRRHDDHDPRRPRPHRRAGPRQGFSFRRSSKLPQDPGARRAARRLGRHQSRAHLGRPADQISRRSTPPISTTTTWRSPPTRSCRPRGAPRSRSAAVDAMPPAIKAVQDGVMYATVRNPPAASTAAPSSPASRR